MEHLFEAVSAGLGIAFLGFVMAIRPPRSRHRWYQCPTCNRWRKDD